MFSGNICDKDLVEAEMVTFLLRTIGSYYLFN